jgi:D-lactate dehydrogenase
VACEQNGISVVRVPDYSPYAIAEHAVALMMVLNRKIHRANNRVREGNFSLDGLLGFDMHGRTAGVIGAGKIGSCLLNILHGFGCRLLVHTRTPRQDLVDRLGVRYVELDELFAESDVISLHAPLTPETKYLINSKTVSKMKQGVMFINTSRGGLVDTMALINGLKSGRIGYAGLDVYEEEGEYFFEDFSNRVLLDDMLARLMTFNNVIVTSHQGSLTDIAQGNIVDATLENIHEFEIGKRFSMLTNAVIARA